MGSWYQQVVIDPNQWCFHAVTMLETRLVVELSSHYLAGGSFAVPCPSQQCKQTWASIRKPEGANQSISAWGVCEYSVNLNFLRWWWCIRCVCPAFLIYKRFFFFFWTNNTFTGQKLKLIKTKKKNYLKKMVSFAKMQSNTGRTK